MLRTNIVQKIKTHSLYLITIFFNLNVCEKMWGGKKKIDRDGQDEDDNIILRMSFAFWMTKATNAHS